MSLNWNIEKVRDYKAVAPGSGAQWSATEAIIWLTMAVGIDRITEANAEEFYRRVHLYETQQGAHLLTNDGEPSPITLEEVKRRVGLTTNVSRLTKTEFAIKLKRLSK